MYQLAAWSTEILDKHRLCDMHQLQFFSKEQYRYIALPAHQQHKTNVVSEHYMQVDPSKSVGSLSWNLPNHLLILLVSGGVMWGPIFRQPPKSNDKYTMNKNNDI